MLLVGQVQTALQFYWFIKCSLLYSGTDWSSVVCYTVLLVGQVQTAFQFYCFTVLLLYSSTGWSSTDCFTVLLVGQVQTAL